MTLKQSDVLKAVQSDCLKDKRKKACSQPVIASRHSFLWETVHNLKILRAFSFNLDETPLQFLMKRTPLAVVLSDLSFSSSLLHQERRPIITLTLWISLDGSAAFSQIIDHGKHIPCEFEDLNPRLLYVQSNGMGWQSKFPLVSAFENSLFPSFREKRRRLNLEGAPILIVFYGHVNCRNPGLLPACYRMNIVPVTLPAHTSSMLQPLDRGVNALMSTTPSEHMGEELWYDFQVRFCAQIVSRHRQRSGTGLIPPKIRSLILLRVV